MGYGEKQHREKCNTFLGVSSEIPHVSLCIYVAWRGTHFYRRLRDKTFRWLFLSPLCGREVSGSNPLSFPKLGGGNSNRQSTRPHPIDSFSGYFKKSTERIRISNLRSQGELTPERTKVWIEDLAEPQRSLNSRRINGQRSQADLLRAIPISLNRGPIKAMKFFLFFGMGKFLLSSWGLAACLSRGLGCV